MADDRVAALAVGAQLIRAALAEHAEPRLVVDVQERVIGAGEHREAAEVRGRAGQAAHAVDADQPRARPVSGEQFAEFARVVVAERDDRRAPRLSGGAAVDDRSLGAAVKKDGAAVDESGDDHRVDLGAGGDDERVLAAQQRRQVLLDLFVLPAQARHAG